jgi:hypothetical protein
LKALDSAKRRGKFVGAREQEWVLHATTLGDQFSIVKRELERQMDALSEQVQCCYLLSCYMNIGFLSLPQLISIQASILESKLLDSFLVMDSDEESDSQTREEGFSGPVREQVRRFSAICFQSCLTIHIYSAKPYLNFSY